MATPATQSAVLDAARRLFAEKGFPGTSLREITREAGVNLAAVNYHFGSKEGLLLAVLRDCLDPINAERLRMLDEAEAASGDDPVPIETLFRCLLQPVFQSLREQQMDEQMPCLLARMHHEPHPELNRMLPEIMTPIVGRFVAAAIKSLPHLDVEAVSIRGQFVIGSMLHVLDNQTTINGISLDDHDALLEDLILFAAAGFRAPLADAS
ncbi:MAG: TetR/AcrR family transcriptional regulator [Planctomycetota bacterium]